MHPLILKSLGIFVASIEGDRVNVVSESERVPCVVDQLGQSLVLVVDRGRAPLGHAGVGQLEKHLHSLYLLRLHQVVESAAQAVIKIFHRRKVIAYKGE